MSRTGIVCLVLALPNIARADKSTTDTKAPLRLPDLSVPNRELSVGLTLASRGDMAMAGLIDLRAALTLAGAVTFAARLPIATIPGDPYPGDEHGTALGGLTLAMLGHRRVVGLGGEYRIGVNTVVTLPTNMGDEATARELAAIEFLHAPGEVYNSDASARIEVAARWDHGAVGYELMVGAGTSNRLSSVNYEQNQFYFVMLGTGVGVAAGPLDLLAEGRVISGESAAGSADIGIRLRRPRITVRLFRTFSRDYEPEIQGFALEVAERP